MEKISAGKFHSEPPSRFTSLDHLVGAPGQRERHGEAERPGSFQIDDQLDLGGLLDRQITGLFALENSADINADQTVVFPVIASVAHQAPSRSELAKKVDRGHRMADRQCGQLFAAGNEQLIGHDHEPTGSQFDQGCECNLDLAFAACMEDMKLQPEDARCCLCEKGSAILGLVGLTSKAMLVALGITSCSSSSRFGPTSTFKLVTPVRLPPGRF